MKIEYLAETDVVSLFLEQGHLFFEMTVVAHGGARYKMLARNRDVSPIGVAFGQLHIRGNFTNVENFPSLGELESVAVIENGVVLEGDFGNITIHANLIEVQAV